MWPLDKDVKHSFLCDIQEAFSNRVVFPLIRYEWAVFSLNRKITKLMKHLAKILNLGNMNY